MPTVLVTGAGRGIGSTIALQLAEAGWQVHAGVRQPEDGERLAADGSASAIHPVILDVTEPDHITALPETLGGSLDDVVNNAGIVVSGPPEAVTLADLRQQFEVNVVGQLAVTQALLPLLRSSHGRIVLVGSISGRVAAPLLGPYTASKFALEGLADTLRIELRPCGIKVALIEPGSIDTDLWRNAVHTADQVKAHLRPEHQDLYANHLAGTRKTAGRIQKTTAPPDKVAAVVLHALTVKKPKARYLVGADARAQVALRAVLPTRAIDALYARAGGVR